MPRNIRRTNEAWESLLTAHARLMRKFGETDIWGDLSMREYDVLYTLSKHGDPLRIGELSRDVLLSQPALSRMVDRLVADGLVERAADPDDGRVVRVSLTEAGRQLQRAVGRKHARDIAEEVGSRLTPEEMEELTRLCGKLAGNSPGKFR